MANDLNKLRMDVDFLSTASPQQMSMVGQRIQQGQRSDGFEPLAFLIADNMQKELRQPNPAAPQQTVMEKRLAELQAQTNPMLGGIPNVGPNQMALQQAAAQNPNMAGVAAAPENVPGAATGGLVAFAEGGEVRGFSGMDGSFANLIPHSESGTNIYDNLMSIPSGLKYLAGETGNLNNYLGSKIYHAVTDSPIVQKAAERWKARAPYISQETQVPEGADMLEKSRNFLLAQDPNWKFAGEDGGKEEPTPKHEEVKPGADKTPTTQKITEQKPAPLATQKTSAASTDKISGLGTPSFRNAFGLDDVAASPATPPVSSTDSNEKQIQAIQDALGTPYSMSAELKSQLEKKQADAEKASFFKAGLSGLGAMMAAPTEHWKKALGMGLISAVNQYDQDKDAGRYEDALLAQQMAEEKAPIEARQQAGLEFLKQRAAMQTAGAKSQGDLVKQALANQAKIQAAQIAAAARQQGMNPDQVEQKLLVNLGATLGPAGMSAEEIRQMASSIARGGVASPGAGGAPLSILGRISGDQYQGHQ